MKLRDILREVEFQGELTLFRGQSGKFYEKIKQGYSGDAYGMLFLSDNINSAHFYSKPGFAETREILVFKVPNKIAKIQGKYIDRASEERAKARAEGYLGITSNVGELNVDKGEVGLFYMPKPIKSWRTESGAFTQEQVEEMKAFGLGPNEQREETQLP